MQLLYTGAKSNRDEQGRKEYSLGGYMSTTLVPDSALGAVFSAMSKLTFERQQEEVVALAIYNDDVDIASDVKVWVEEVQNSKVELSIAVSGSAVDENGDTYFESIRTPSSRPQGLIFKRCTSEATALNIGAMAPKSALCLWIARKPVNARVLSSAAIFDGEQSAAIIIDYTDEGSGSSSSMSQSQSQSTSASQS